ncbi:hypothetical protein JRI60_22995 [Archangium violaceum]|uniref:hypothetical protein n=1 Tax=Archangium violaceum TaxID=83451 RepID=UPI00194DBCB5|nr:hypothetical protein [Archangium violaceum]QRO01681.1 hypothetical protein JRI60_22995 [Archangium violaceum]
MFLQLRKTTLLCCFFVLHFTSCRSGKEQFSPCQVVDGGLKDGRASCEVYAALIAYGGQEFSKAVVLNETITLGGFDRSRVGSVDGRALEDMCSRSLGSVRANAALIHSLCQSSGAGVPLSDVFPPSNGPHLVPVDRIWSRDGDGGLVARAAGDLSVYVVFSKVAFDEQKRSAVVYMGYHCGPRCGEGCLFSVERTKDGWKNVGCVWRGWES